MYDFSSYIRISPERLSPCAPAAQETCGFVRFQQRERTLCGRPRGSSYCSDDGKRARTRVHRCFWLATPLPQGALHGPSRRRRRFERRIFFLKTVPNIGHQ